MPPLIYRDYRVKLDAYIERIITNLRTIYNRSWYFEAVIDLGKHLFRPNAAPNRTAKHSNLFKSN